MRSMTDVQASDHFAELLDAAEHGETVVVTRDGAPVAQVSPPEPSAVDALEDVLERFPLPEEAIDGLEKAIREHRAWVGEGMRERPTE